MHIIAEIILILIYSGRSVELTPVFGAGRDNVAIVFYTENANDV
jgi:hypothetical protein